MLVMRAFDRSLNGSEIEASHDKWLRAKDSTCTSRSSRYSIDHARRRVLDDLLENRRQPRFVFSGIPDPRGLRPALSVSAVRAIRSMKL